MDQWKTGLFLGGSGWGEWTEFGRTIRELSPWHKKGCSDVQVTYFYDAWQPYSNPKLCCKEQVKHTKWGSAGGSWECPRRNSNNTSIASHIHPEVRSSLLLDQRRENSRQLVPHPMFPFVTQYSNKYIAFPHKYLAGRSWEELKLVQASPEVFLKPLL